MELEPLIIKMKICSASSANSFYINRGMRNSLWARSVTGVTL